MSEREHHRPAMPGAAAFEAIETTDHGADPAVLKGLRAAHIEIPYPQQVVHRAPE